MQPTQAWPRRRGSKLFILVVLRDFYTAAVEGALTTVKSMAQTSANTHHTAPTSMDNTQQNQGMNCVTAHHGAKMNSLHQFFPRPAIHQGLALWPLLGV